LKHVMETLLLSQRLPEVVYVGVRLSRSNYKHCTQKRQEHLAYILPLMPCSVRSMGPLLLECIRADGQSSSGIVPFTHDDSVQKVSHYAQTITSKPSIPQNKFNYHPTNAQTRQGITIKASNQKRHHIQLSRISTGLQGPVSLRNRCIGAICPPSRNNRKTASRNSSDPWQRSSSLGSSNPLFPFPVACAPTGAKPSSTFLSTILRFGFGFVAGIGTTNVGTCFSNLTACGGDVAGR
jgi:hypothetical protein